MAQYQILTKTDGKKIAINNERISYFEDIEDDCTLIVTIDGDELEVQESINDIFPDPSTPTRRDKKTPFIPIKLSSN